MKFDLSQIITGLGVITGFIGGIVGVVYTFRGKKVDAKKEEKIAEVAEKQTEIKVAAETAKTDTARISEMMDFAMDQLKNLQEENKHQRSEMTLMKEDHDQLRKKLDTCLEEKSKEGIKQSERIYELEMAFKEEQLMRRRLEEKVRDYREQTGKVIEEGIKVGLLPDRRKKKKE